MIVTFPTCNPVVTMKNVCWCKWIETENITNWSHQLLYFLNPSIIIHIDSNRIIWFSKKSEKEPKCLRSGWLTFGSGAKLLLHLLLTFSLSSSSFLLLQVNFFFAPFFSPASYLPPSLFFSRHLKTSSSAIHDNLKATTSVHPIQENLKSNQASPKVCFYSFTQTLFLSLSLSKLLHFTHLLPTFGLSSNYISSLELLCDKIVSPSLSIG